MKNKLKVALDIDDCLAGFFESYRRYFPGERNMKDEVITKNVYKLRNNKKFWTELEVIDRPNFEPHIYATKRINPKSYTREWLIKNGFPNKPIYQTLTQGGNKADIIKGRCDVLIDDSPSNVYKCIKSGVPALLIDRPHNQYAGPLYRIYSLDIDEIMFGYKLLML